MIGTDETKSPAETDQQASKWRPRVNRDLVIALTLVATYAALILALNLGPARGVDIAAHGDIPTDTFVLRSVDRSVASADVRGTLAMQIDDEGVAGNEPTWYGRWQPVPYIVQVFAKDVSGGWAFGRLFSILVMASGAAFMGVQLSRLTATRWVGPLAMLAMLSTSVARWFADSFFTMPYDSAGVALAIGIVAWALWRKRDLPATTVPWLAPSLLAFTALLLFQEAIPSLLLAVAIAAVVLGRASLIRWVPTIGACVVAGAGGGLLRLWYHVVVYGGLENALESMSSKGAQRFSSLGTPSEHLVKWVGRLADFMPWHSIVLASLLVLALGLLLWVRTPLPSQSRGAALVMGFALISGALWPTLARQHAFIHNSTQDTVIAPIGALVGLLAWVVTERASRWNGARAVLSLGAVAIVAALAAGFSGYKIDTAPNLTADGHERYALMASIASGVDQACAGDAGCAAVIAVVPGADSKAIYINVVRQRLLERRGRVEGGVLELDLGETPATAVLIDTHGAQRVESDDGRRWTRTGGVPGYTFWAGVRGQ